MILIIDNYDSFVFNIARYIEELGEPALVLRNDRLGVEDVDLLHPEAIIISPGPCAPAQAGVSLPLIKAWSGKIPILGVCLGHQAIGEAFGGTIAPAKRPLHGQSAPITHEAQGLFANLPSPIEVARYHSLVVQSTPEMEKALRIDALSAEGEIMALSHRTHPTYGVQFHPESVLTQSGHAFFKSFLDAAKQWQSHALV
jgi:para-aminobenzoate synthetase component 2